nr:hypothetical protein OBXNPYZZ_OBXNPYZZ_CDS_0007 [Microvirus sp.]
MVDIDCDFDAARIDLQFDSPEDLFSFLVGFVSVMAELPDDTFLQDDSDELFLEAF